MAYTTPRTWADEILVDAEDLNTEIRDNVSALYSMAAYPSRNLLQNGQMQVSQRGLSSAGNTATGVWLIDRWRSTISSLGTWTASRENDAPTATGLRTSLKMLCTTANAAPAAGGVFLVRQILEGYDVQRIKKGTASAEQLTLSFWVKANVTGTFVVELEDQDNTRYCSKTYTINASGTWEQKTITFPADATGAFDNDENGSLALNFWLGAGTNFTSGTLGTTWHTTTANRAVGGTNVAATLNNYWQLTGVQLETGTVATPFEFVPFGDELRRCQRYFEKSFALETAPSTNVAATAVMFTGSSSAANEIKVPIRFAVWKRTTAYTMTAYPAFTTAVGTWYYERSGGISGGATTTFSNSSHSGANATVNIGVAWTAGLVYGNWTCDAEL